MNESHDNEPMDFDLLFDDELEAHCQAQLDAMLGDD